jgi:hypothetical protein
VTLKIDAGGVGGGRAESVSRHFLHFPSFLLSPPANEKQKLVVHVQ